MSGEVSKKLSTAERFAALSRVGVALTSELDEGRLLHLIAETACDMTGASFAAFTLRPTDELGQPLVPAEGNLFYLAAVVGVTPAQEELFRRMPLGGEGLLAPIFRHGLPVIVADALAQMGEQSKNTAEITQGHHHSAFTYMHGQAPSEAIHAIGIPRGHPVVRSFLGVPLLDRFQGVRGGLLLGHIEPDRFTKEDEILLVGLAAQAAVALENARLYRTLQMRAQELDAIFESITDGIALVDKDGNVLRENGMARRLREHLHKQPGGTQFFEELLHKPFEQTLQPATEPGMSATIGELQTGQHEYVVNASPLSLPVNVISQAQQNIATINGTGPTLKEQATMVGAVIVWHDVTEARRLLLEQRIHAETEARRALLQVILDELPGSAYLVRGNDARLVLANRAASMVWGATWPEGMSMREFLRQHGIRIFGIDGLPQTFEQLVTYRAVQRGETVRHHQEVIRHPDGTTLPVLVNAVALKARDLSGPLSPTWGDENEMAAIVVHQDVTALKEAEQLKDEFIGIAAHELRNPLAILKGFAQTLIIQTARGRGPELADWQMESLQGIDQATTRLVELTDDLLDVTRVQGGRLTLHIEPVDIVALTQRVLARLQMTTEQHTLQLKASAAYLVVFIDPRRMEQVLNNLINNAIKYSPEGGTIELSLTHDEPKGIILLSIHDNGIGIPANQQARIFGRFVRAENAQMRGIGGTGLGLYLCRELVERQGGRIWFESVEEQGSTFFVSLPRATHGLEPSP